MTLTLVAQSKPLSYHPNRIIIKFKPDVELVEKSNIRADLNAKRLRRFRLINAELWEIKGKSVDETVDLYRNDPRIEYIEPDGTIYLPKPVTPVDETISPLNEQAYIRSIQRDPLIPNDQLFDEQWGLHNHYQYLHSIEDCDIDAPEAWFVQTDCEEIIGVVDTGIDYNHIDLDDNMWINPDEGEGDFIGYEDGCPGFCGIDDDGDAGTTAESNTTDGIDNDGDGLIDETGTDFRDEDVMAADYNRNDTMLVGIDGIFGTNDDDQGDVLLAANDDDENGYADDLQGWDWSDDDNDPYDDHGHGTMVSGIIGAEANNWYGIAGICWTAQIMNLKIFYEAAPDSFVADISDIILAWEYALSKGVRVSNNSWGGEGYNDVVYNAILSATEQDHLFVFGAGNDLNNIDEDPFYPAAYDLDNIISVTSTDRYDEFYFTWIGPNSNYGPISVDLGAPGHTIRTTYLDDDYTGGICCDGTSFATAHVTGTVGLLWTREPTLSALEIKQRILGSVDPVEIPGIRWLTGGRLNTYTALQPPVSEIYPTEFNLILDQNTITDTTIILQNTGTGLLTWWISNREKNWLRIYPTEGSIESGEIDTLDLTIYTTNIEPGSDNGSLTFIFNDPTRTSQIIPVNIDILPELVPQFELSTFNPAISLIAGDEAVLPLEITNIGLGTLHWELAGFETDVDLSGVNILWHDDTPFQLDIFHSTLFDDLIQSGAAINEYEYEIWSNTLNDIDIIWTKVGYSLYNSNELNIINNWIETGGTIILESGGFDIFAYNEILDGTNVKYSKINALGLIEFDRNLPALIGIDSIYIQYTLPSLVSRYHLIAEYPADILFYSINGSSSTLEIRKDQGHIYAACQDYIHDFVIDEADNRLYGNQLFDWLANPFKPDITRGYLSQNHSDTMNFHIKTSRLETGIYNSQLTFYTNEPDTILINLSVTVLDENYECTANGDTNYDNIADVLDVVMIVDHILENYVFAEIQICNADVNVDEAVDVIDIVLIVDMILSE